MNTILHIDAPPISPDAPDTHSTWNTLPAPCIYKYIQKRVVLTYMPLTYLWNNTDPYLHYVHNIWIASIVTGRPTCHKYSESWGSAHFQDAMHYICWEAAVLSCLSPSVLVISNKRAWFEKDELLPYISSTFTGSKLRASSRWVQVDPITCNQLLNYQPVVPSDVLQTSAGICSSSSK